jgi:hypothetical protein
MIEACTFIELACTGEDNIEHVVHISEIWVKPKALAEPYLAGPVASCLESCFSSVRCFCSSGSKTLCMRSAAISMKPPPATTAL